MPQTAYVKGTLYFGGYTIHYATLIANNENVHQASLRLMRDATTHFRQIRPSFRADNGTYSSIPGGTFVV